MKSKTRTAALAATLILPLFTAATASAAVSFSSTFDGTSPWNWDGTTTTDDTANGNTTPSGPSVGGTGELVTTFTGPASNGDSAYAYENTLTGDASVSSIVSSFTLSFANITDINQTNGEPIFYLGSSQGNGSDVTEFSSYFSAIGLSLNADAQVVEFRTTARDRFFGTLGSVSSAYSLADTYNLVLTTTLDVGATDDVVASLDIFESGMLLETVTATHTGRAGTPTNFGNLTGYALGTLDGGSSDQAYSGSLTFDDFSSEAVPEPSAAILGGLAFGGLALRRRR